MYLTTRLFAIRLCILLFSSGAISLLGPTPSSGGPTMTAAECSAAYLKSLDDLNACLGYFTHVAAYQPSITAERRAELENKKKSGQPLNPLEELEILAYDH